MVTDAVERAARDVKDALHERLPDAVEQVASVDDWGRALDFAAWFRAGLLEITLLTWARYLDSVEPGRVPGPEPGVTDTVTVWTNMYPAAQAKAHAGEPTRVRLRAPGNESWVRHRRIADVEAGSGARLACAPELASGL